MGSHRWFLFKRNIQLTIFFFINSRFTIIQIGVICHRIHEIEHKHEQQYLLRNMGSTMEYNFLYSMFLYTIQLLKGLLCFLNKYTLPQK